MLAPRSLVRALVCAAGLVGSAIAPVQAQTSSASEAQVKAAFLYNFAAFTEWPELAGDTLVVGVVGDEAAADEVARTISGKTVADRVVAARRVDSPAEAGTVHILFITAGSGREDGLIPRPEGGPRPLIVGEEEGFASNGGMVNFYLEQGRVRFEVNVDAVEGAGLRMSSRLLRLARLVSSLP